MSTLGGYHEYIGGCSVHRGDIMMHVGEQVGKSLSISIENLDVRNIPRLTISSRCTHGIPPAFQELVTATYKVLSLIPKLLIAENNHVIDILVKHINDQAGFLWPLHIMLSEN